VNTRDAVKQIVRLGGKVSLVRGTGEIEVTHPAWDRVIRTSHWSRRKTATKELAQLLKRARVSNGLAS
jgi:hypothetical protein